jgi:hypothetical protein
VSAHVPVVLAEFDSAEKLARAARRLRELGCRDLDAFTPYPLPDLEPVLGIERSRVARGVLGLGLFGGLFAYVFQWWISAVDYPLDVGGRPLHAGPAFIPITFETSVLFGAFAAIVGFVAYCGLPRLWDPLFEIEGFERATIDRFFLGVGRASLALGAEQIASALGDAGALRVVDVEQERAR